MQYSCYTIKMIGISANNNKLATLAEENGIRFIILHGSRSDGSAQYESDVDVAVYLEPSRLEHFGYGAYEEILDGLVGALSTGGIGKLDLVVLNTANILLRYEITSKGQLLYGDAYAYAQYCAFSYRDYIDAKPLFDLESFMIEKRHELIQQHVAQ